MKRNLAFAHIIIIIIASFLIIGVLVFFSREQLLRPKVTDVTRQVPSAIDRTLYKNTYYGFQINRTATMEISEPNAQGYSDASENAEVIKIVDTNLNRNASFWIHPETIHSYKNMQDFVSQLFDIKNGFIEPKHIPFDPFSDIRFKVTDIIPLEISGHQAIILQAEELDSSATSDFNIDYVFVEYSKGNVFRISKEPTSGGTSQDTTILLSYFTFR